MIDDKKSRKTIAINSELHKKIKKEAFETDSGIQRVADKYIELGFKYTKLMKESSAARELLDEAVKAKEQLQTN